MELPHQFNPQQYARRPIINDDQFYYADSNGPPSLMVPHPGYHQMNSEYQDINTQNQMQKHTIDSGMTEQDLIAQVHML